MNNNTNSQNLGQNFLDSLERIVEEVRNRKLTFLVIGRTGWGKSSTVNSLLGQDVCPVGEDEPTTLKVNRHDFRINGIECSIFDTPGLCDAPPEVMKKNGLIGKSGGNNV